MLEKLETPMLLPVQPGEPIIIFELVRHRMLLDEDHRVIYLPRSQRWSGQDAYVRGLLKEEALPPGAELVETRRGRVVESRCLFPVGATEVLRTEILFIQEESCEGEAGGEWAHEVVISAQGPEVRWDGEALEQVWGTGARQRIVLEAPFEVVAHREPGVVGAEEAWVHLRLTQRVEGEGLHSIALTLRAAAAAVEGLPLQSALHACVEGVHAAELVERLREACAGHGVEFPWKERR